MRLIAVGLFASLAIAAPASAQTTAPEGKEPSPEKKLCKPVAPATGTRMGPSRVCKTAAEWETARLAAQQDMELRQRNGANASEFNGSGEPR